MSFYVRVYVINIKFGDQYPPNPGNARHKNSIMPHILDFNNKKLCYRRLHSTPRVKLETRILPIRGRYL